MIKVRFYIVGVLLSMSYQGTHAAAFWKKKPKAVFDATALVHVSCEGSHALRHELTKEHITCAFVCAQDGTSMPEELERQAEMRLAAISNHEQPKALGVEPTPMSPATDIPEEFRKVLRIAAFKVTKRYMVAELGSLTFDVRRNDVSRYVALKFEYKIGPEKQKKPTIYDYLIVRSKTKALLFSLGDMLGIGEQIIRLPIDASKILEQDTLKNVRKPTVLLNLAELMQTHFS